MLEIPVAPCVYVKVAYESMSGLWRGFVMPYDITYEAKTKEDVIEALNDMVELHREALEKYNNPSHLRDRPLSDEEDRKKYLEISWDLFNRFLKKEPIIQGRNYYAEAKLSA